jgi:hypothetical protein
VHDISYGNAASPAAVNITRQTPILPDATGYSLALQRLAIPIASIPSFVAALQVGSQYADNLMIYSFTTSVGGFTSPQKFIEWLPQTTYWPQPTGTVEYCLQSDKPFYHAYNISTVFDMFNESLQQSLVELNALSPLPAEYTDVRLYFDKTTMTPKLFIPTSVYQAQLKIYFNNQMAALFSSWNYVTVGKNTANGQDNLLVFYSNLSNAVTGGVVMAPEVFAFNYFSPVQTVQIRTSMPIIQEATQPVNSNYGQSSLLPTINQNYPSSESILTDFTIDSSSVTSEGGYYIYNKTDTTRFITLAGGKTIQNFYISVYWTDNSNAAYPMELLPNTLISMKMTFIPTQFL